MHGGRIAQPRHGLARAWVEHREVGSASGDVHRPHNFSLSFFLPFPSTAPTLVDTMFAARQTFNLFQKRAFSASASQV